MKLPTLLKWFIYDDSGRIIIWQAPNIPLISWILLMSASWFADGSKADKLMSYSKGALFVWAALEIFRGVNPFRRLLGLLVMIYIFFSLKSEGFYTVVVSS